MPRIPSKPERWRRVSKPAAILVAAILLFLLAGSGFAARKGEDLAPYLSFSADTDGMKGVRTLLERKGIDTAEWRLPWIRLPHGESRTLIAVEPSGIDPKEQEAVRNWIRLGNHLVVFGHDVSRWEQDGVEASVSKSGRGDLGRSARVTRHVQGNADETVFTAERPLSELRLHNMPNALPLFSDEEGLLAARYPIGEGSLTLLLVPEWLQNGVVLRQQHFELLWPVLLESAEGGSLLWDEYHHGYHTKSGLLNIYPEWMLAAYLQSALVVLFVLWRRGKRFGPVWTPREWTVRRGDETLLAVSGWHRKRRQRRAAIESQTEYMRQLAQERWGVRASAQPEELVETARVRCGEALAGRMSGVLARLQAVREPGRYTDKMFLQDSSQLAEIVNVMEKE